MKTSQTLKTISIDSCRELQVTRNGFGSHIYISVLNVTGNQMSIMICQIVTTMGHHRNEACKTFKITINSDINFGPKTNIKGEFYQVPCCGMLIAHSLLTLKYLLSPLYRIEQSTPFYIFSSRVTFVQRSQVSSEMVWRGQCVQ